MRAGIDAVAAADALAAVGRYGRVDIHLAGFGAGIAIDTFRGVEMHAVEGDPVKETVDRTQRADVLAEGPVYDEACDEDQAENDEL